MKTIQKMIVVAVCVFVLPVWAGVVTTKDTDDGKGGYHDKKYHLKGKGHTENFVNRDDNWHNPFRGFTKGVTKDGSGHSKTSKHHKKKKVD
jgi:hypothetical protein